MEPQGGGLRVKVVHCPSGEGVNKETNPIDSRNPKDARGFSPSNPHRPEFEGSQVVCPPIRTALRPEGVATVASSRSQARLRGAPVPWQLWGKGVFVPSPVLVLLAVKQDAGN